MPYLGAPMTQFDGSHYAGVNCVIIAFRKLIDVWTLGYWKPLGRRLRYLSGDTSGGVGFFDADKASRLATNGEVDITVVYWAPPETIKQVLKAGRVGGVMILCSVTRYTPFRTNYFMGRHCVNFLAFRVYNGQEQVRVMDPGFSKATYRWWPLSLLIKAAKACADGDVHVFYTRDLTGVTRKAKSAGSMYASASITATKVASFAKDAALFIVTTVGGGSWIINEHTGRGWNKHGTGRYSPGGRVR